MTKSESFATITETGEVFAADPSDLKKFFEALQEVPHGGMKTVDVYLYDAVVRDAMDVVREYDRGPAFGVCQSAVDIAKKDILHRLEKLLSQTRAGG